MVKNSSNEIAEVAVEAVSRSRGQFVESQDDRRRQKEFLKIRARTRGSDELGQIGSKFLLRYEKLLA